MTSRLRTNDSTMMVLLLVAVILSFSFFAFAQNSPEEIKPWERQMPKEIREAKSEKPMGAILMETSCQPLNGGDSLRKGDPGYEQCQSERGTVVIPANKKIQ